MKIRKKVIIPVVASIIAIPGFFFVSFHPPGATSLGSPNDSRNRLLATRVEANQPTIIIQACDWPYTFSQPFNVGEAHWPEKYSKINFLWSADGSLILCEASLRNENEVLYEAAYDYRKHQGLNRFILRLGRSACDSKIRELVAERGGRGPFVRGIPPIGDYD